MSAGGTRRPDSDEWADGGRRARPRYLTLTAPSPPAPNGHRAGGSGRRIRIPRGERRSAAGRALLGARNRCPAPVMVAALILAGALSVGATALLAWVLWRLATAGG